MIIREISSFCPAKTIALATKRGIMTENPPQLRDITQEYDIIDVTENGVSQTWVEVCVEDSINLLVNGNRVASLTITPNNLESYAYGYLVCEGIVSNINAITDVRVDFPNIYAEVSSFSREISPEQTEIRSSGCVGIKDDMGNIM